MLGLTVGGCGWGMGFLMGRFLDRVEGPDTFSCSSPFESGGSLRAVPKGMGLSPVCCFYHHSEKGAPPKRTPLKKQSLTEAGRRKETKRERERDTDTHREKERRKEERKGKGKEFLSGCAFRVGPYPGSQMGEAVILVTHEP